MPVKTVFHPRPSDWGTDNKAVYVALSPLRLQSGPELKSNAFGFLPQGALLMIDAFPRAPGRRHVRTDQCHLRDGWISLYDAAGNDLLGAFPSGATGFLSSGGYASFEHTGPSDQEVVFPTGLGKTLLVSQTLATQAGTNGSAEGSTSDQSGLEQQPGHRLTWKVAGQLTMFGNMLMRKPESGQFALSNTTKEEEEMVKATLMSVADVRAMEAEYLTAAGALDAKLRDFRLGLKIRLGQAFLSRRTNLDHLVDSWTKGGVSDMSRIEFRKHVRQILADADPKYPFESRPIDALFDEMDEDGGGTLDSNELKMSLKHIRDLASNAHQDRNESEALVSRMRQRAEAASALATKISEASVSEERLQDIEAESFSKAKPGSTGTRIGMVLAASSVKLHDHLHSWESSDGEVNKIQFRANVRRLCIDAPDEEIDQLFDRFDADHGGTLDLREMKVALANLKDEALDFDYQKRHMHFQTQSLWNVALEAQDALMMLRKKDDAAQASRVAQAAAKKAEAIKAAQRMQEAKARIRAEKAAKLAERLATLVAPS